VEKVKQKKGNVNTVKNPEKKPSFSKASYSFISMLYIELGNFSTIFCHYYYYY